MEREGIKERKGEEYERRDKRNLRYGVYYLIGRIVYYFWGIYVLIYFRIINIKVLCSFCRRVRK